MGMGMGRACAWFLLGLFASAITLGASQMFAPYPDINNKTFIKLYVDAHNKFRSEVKPSAANMLYMTFDIALARIAKTYAKKCIWDHNEHRNIHPDPKFRPFGENMWMGGASERPFNVAAAIEAFHSEIKYYDFSTHKCTHVCGHYTQVVWASSYKVGCAVAFCHKVFKGGENMGMLVCDYGPAGNYKGTRPYKAGKPCDECQAKDTCQNNLCRNRKRDQENTSYIHWYPPSYSCCGFKDFVNVYSICSCVFLKILLSWIKF
ncbi:glioma pathogenesis-related protein 1 isoform X1 [Anolis carolinensis]|uniref:glioma pathogenesis-related protein 1 isoform X1 n=1 Tax=Anolis carolinensis TaxID=28377 RepID=UPI002F2B864F